MITNRQQDLTCSICMTIFNEPYMCNCGHSFCKNCIERWMMDNQPNCPTCRTNVSRTAPNISLRQVVEERNKSRLSIVEENDSPTSSGSSLQTMTGSSERASALSREESIRSTNRRCRFSDNDEVFDEYATFSDLLKDDLLRLSAPRVPAPTRPVRGILVKPPQYADDRISQSSSIEADALDSQDDDLDEYDEINSGFCRNSNFRRSEYIPRAADDSSAMLPSRADQQFKRDSTFRRSLGVIRRKKNKVNQESEDPEPHTMVVDLGSTQPIKPKKLSKSKLKALWKRLTGTKTRQAVVPPSTTFRRILTFQSLCSYMGSGAHFKRIGKGEEITIIVCGRRGIGKTTFLDNLTLSVEASGKHEMIGLTERLSYSRRSSFSSTLAHLTSAAMLHNDRFRVIDVVDADCENRLSDGVYDCATSNAFVTAADAAILLHSSVDASTLLTVMAIHRQFGNRKIPCALVSNNFGNRVDAYVERTAEGLANKMGARRFETNLSKPNSNVIGIIQHLVDCVMEARGNLPEAH